jgi:hypothetical protein
MADELESRRKRRLAGKYPVPFFVRATEDEARLIERNARAARRSHSRFLAELGAADGAAERLPALPSEALLSVFEELAFQLQKIGVNLNQLAHREHAADYGTADPPTDEEILGTVRDVAEAVRRVREAMA